jgi:siroheme synthase-like protein
VSPCLDPERLIGRSCLVVGGGIVAARTLGPLLETGARVTVVSPRLAPALLEAARDGRLRWRPREYVSGDLAGFALVIVATDDDGVNARVADEARERSVEVIAEGLAVRAPGSARAHAGDG